MMSPPPIRADRHHRAFTLVELLMVITISSMMTMLAVPLMSSGNAAAVRVAARILQSDLERAQLMAVAHPDRRIGLRIDDDGGGWSLVDVAAPDQPLSDDVTEKPIRLRFGRGRGQAVVTVHVETTWHGGIVEFDHLGGLATPGPPLQIRLEDGPHSSTLRISASTGWISIDS